MNSPSTKPPSTLLVVSAFIIVYLVWGSTYFFIQQSIAHIPPLLVGLLRFITAGFLLLVWCLLKGEKVLDIHQIKVAAVSGVLLLFIGNGAVIWSEKTLPSSLVAVLVSSAPIWFVLLDRSHWKENLKARSTILGLLIGLAGVILLFGNQIKKVTLNSDGWIQIMGLVILIIGSISWSAGSLFSKYKSVGNGSVNTAWQMIAGGLAFLPASLITGEWKGFHPSQIPINSWLSLGYLIFFGSLIAYSAYVWLLQVQPATRVSTYAYVNPVVAVILGVFLVNEKINTIQIVGLAIILLSVLLINLSKYKNHSGDRQKEINETSITKKQKIA